MIYLFIAGSYTPWLCLKTFPPECWSIYLSSIVWILAFIGILYQQIFHEKYKWLETTFYVVIGLVPSLAVLEMVLALVTHFSFYGYSVNFCPLFLQEDTSGIAELRYGGLAYLTGIIFFKLDGIIPFAHAIWHLHVVIGSVFHYYAVSTYLIID